MYSPYIHIVNYYETDKMQVTHHSNYIRFMEEARVDFLNQIGYGFEKLESDGIVSPVTAVSCDFKKPTTFAQKIQVQVVVKKCSTVKLTFEYIMKCDDDMVAIGTSSHCFLENGKIIQLSERYPDLYAKLKEIESL